MIETLTQISVGTPTRYTSAFSRKVRNLAEFTAAPAVKVFPTEIIQPTTATSFPSTAEAQTAKIVLQSNMISRALSYLTVNMRGLVPERVIASSATPQSLWLKDVICAQHYPHKTIPQRVIEYLG